MHLSQETNDGLISPKTKVGNWTIVFEYLLQVLSRGWCLPKCIAQCGGTRHQPGPCSRIICSFYSDSRCPETAAEADLAFRHGRKYRHVSVYECVPKI